MQGGVLWGWALFYDSFEQLNVYKLGIDEQ